MGRGGQVVLTWKLQQDRIYIIDCHRKNHNKPLVAASWGCMKHPAMYAMKGDGHLMRRLINYFVSGYCLNEMRC